MHRSFSFMQVKIDSVKELVYLGSYGGIIQNKDKVADFGL